MRTILTPVILHAAACLVLIMTAGCGLDRPEKKEVGLLFGVSVQTMENHFFEEMCDGIREHVEARGDQLIVLSSDFDSNRQNSDVNDLILQKVNGIFINPVHWEQINSSLVNLTNCHIPCIVVDTPVVDKNLILCQVSSDNKQAGHLAARALARKNKRAKVIILQQSANRACIDRVKGFTEELKKHPEITILETRDAPLTEQEATPVMEDLLSTHPDCNAVFAVNDPTALGVITAIELQQKSGQVTVVSVDGSPEAIKAIKKGYLEATAAQFPRRIGQIAAEKMYDHLKGKSVPADIKVPVTLIDSDNVNDFRTE